MTEQPVTILPGLLAAAHTMPFDQFGRYHMLREAVDACRQQLGRDRLRILDVGGYYEADGRATLPIKRFLPADDVTVVDMVACELPDYVQGDGTQLAWPDHSFDLVVSLDTLEHIPQPRRAAFWEELLRVAAHGVILLAPFGTPEVDAAEELLFAYIKVELAAEHQQLKEHRDYGLPILAEWLQFLQARELTIAVYPTGQLRGWLAMMLLKHMLLRMDPGAPAQQLVDTYYNQHLFPTERHEPAYRHLIAASRTPSLSSAIDAVLAPTIGADATDADWTSAFVPVLMSLQLRQVGALREQTAQLRQPPMDTAPLQHARQEISALARLLADHQFMVRQLTEQNASLTNRLADVQHHRHLESERNAAALRDLLERAHWLEGQNTELRRHIAAIQNGRIMRLLARWTVR